MYIVHRRYGDEKRDLTEFITPNAHPVRELADELWKISVDDNDFVKNSWSWVVNNVRYPSGPAKLADRHYQEAFVSGSPARFLLENVVVTGIAAAIPALISGVANPAAIIKNVLIGQGISSGIRGLVSSNYIGFSPKVIHETLDFWAFPSETLRDGIGDCEDTTFLLTSILRTRLSNVFATIGSYYGSGHAWVVLDNGTIPVVLETTSVDIMEANRQGIEEAYPYEPHIRFNDTEVCVINPEGGIIRNKD